MKSKYKTINQNECVCVCVVFAISKEWKGREEEHTEIYSGSPNVG